MKVTEEKYWEYLEMAAYRGQMVIVIDYSSSQKRIRILVVKGGSLRYVKPSSLAVWDG